MSSSTAYPDDMFLTEGVMSRRIIGWLIDVVIIAVLVWVLWWLLALFGVLTLGLGFSAMALLPAVPFCYHFFSLMGSRTATPGQRMMGLTVRRDDDLGPPTVLQAVATVLLFYLTLATTGLLLVVALFTVRHRTLHDLLSGLVVVRVRAMDVFAASRGRWTMAGGQSAR
jgi:uncharacterized RDD family membrane protein YckC